MPKPFDTERLTIDEEIIQVIPMLASKYHVSLVRLAATEIQRLRKEIDQLRPDAERFKHIAEMVINK